jgi:hypothetical protein
MCEGNMYGSLQMRNFCPCSKRMIETGTDESERSEGRPCLMNPYLALSDVFPGSNAVRRYLVIYDHGKREAIGK